MHRHPWIWLALAVVLCAPAHAMPGEQLAIDRQDVRVWTVPTPGEPLRGFRAVTTVRSTLAGLVALLMDTEAAPRWIFRTERMQLLRCDERAGTFVVLADMDFWPLTGRDAVVEGRIVQDPDSLAVLVDSRSTALAEVPPRAGRVRMPALRGRWDFRPLPDGRVEVTMSGHADPGGRIPDFLVNLMIKETPYRTLLGLRREIAAPKYQQYRNPAIREPQP